MLRATWLTFRMHRFEILLSVVLLGLLSVSAVIALGHVRAADPGAECWSRHWDFEGLNGPRPRGCEDRIEAFWPVQSEAGFLSGIVGLAVPFVVGLLLGVPVVGRELELRTAALSWSLSGHRAHWLLLRALPMVVICLVGIGLAAYLLAELGRASYPWNYRGPGRIPELWDLGTEGLSFFGRGVLAVGLGLLSGAIVGRTLPAFAVAATVCVLFVGVGAPATSNMVARSVAVWMESSSNDGGLPRLTTLDSIRISPGGRPIDGRWDEVMAIECPECLTDDTGVTADAWWAGVRTLAAPVESYPTFDRTEALITTSLGVLCLLLTFPVVARRRP